MAFISIDENGNLIHHADDASQTILAPFQSEDSVSNFIQISGLTKVTYAGSGVLGVLVLRY